MGHDSRADAAGEFSTEGAAIAEAELPRMPGGPSLPVGGWRERAAPYLAVSAGAAIGANLRHGVGLWVAAFAPGIFPWGTLLINLSGGLILGCFLTLIAERLAEPPLARLFVATGLLGAYTTFSTFSAETVALFAAGRWVLAAVYIGFSLIGGYGAAWAGIAGARLGRRGG